MSIRHIKKEAIIRIFTKFVIIIIFQESKNCEIVIIKFMIFSDQSQLFEYIGHTPSSDRLHSIYRIDPDSQLIFK